MAEEKFYFDSLQDAESIRQFLEALTEGFAKGELSLASNGDQIVLHPKGLLSFSVKAKRKRGGSKLNIRVAWKELEGDSGQETTPLKVG
ncbi:MAG: amphi-Trp domain-containing protein [Desulfovibrionaceae bacterium]